MNLPSVSRLLRISFSTLWRFPVTLLFSLTAALAIMYIAHSDHFNPEKDAFLLNLVFTCGLGMLSSLAVALFVDRFNLSKGRVVLLNSIVLLATLAYFLQLPDQFRISVVYQLAQLVIALHLLVAFIPYGRGEGQQAFWQYNKVLFLRILSSALYSAVLYIGLSLALLAIRILFRAEIPDEVFGDLIAFILGVFNTWFFLSGMPENWEDMELETDYPKALKIFTQYILLPLVTLYLVILYAYMGKILVSQEWPVGWVSYLVLYFALFGILSLLLIWPKRNEEEHAWLRLFSRVFYITLLPLTVMLLIAIHKRVNEYGITYERYYVLLLGYWLAFLSFYFIFSRVKNIRIIPLSLCLLALLTSFGPQGAEKVSEKSQKNRLNGYLLKNKMMEGDKIVSRTKAMTVEDSREITSIIQYLVEVHGYESLAPYFDTNLDSLFRTKEVSNQRYGQSNALLELMQIDQVMPVMAKEEFNYQTRSVASLPIGEYEYLVSDFSFDRRDLKEAKPCICFSLGNDSLSVCLPVGANVLEFSVPGKDTVKIDLEPLLKQRLKEELAMASQLDEKLFTYQKAGDGFSVLLILSSIEGSCRPQEPLEVRHLKAHALIHKLE